MALVKFADSVGLRLRARGVHLMELESITGARGDVALDVLQVYARVYPNHI